MLNVRSLFFFLENIINKIWIWHKGLQRYNIMIAKVKLSICFKKNLSIISQHLEHNRLSSRTAVIHPVTGQLLLQQHLLRGSQQLVAQACSVDITHRPPPPPTPPPQLRRAPSVTVGLLLSSQPAHFDLFLRCLEVRNQRVPLSLNSIYCKRLHVSAASAPRCSRLVIYYRVAADALASSSSPFLHPRY